MDDPDTDPV
jgi:hypothetical protein